MFILLLNEFSCYNRSCGLNGVCSELTWNKIHKYEFKLHDLCKVYLTYSDCYNSSLPSPCKGMCYDTGVDKVIIHFFIPSFMYWVPMIGLVSIRTIDLLLPHHAPFWIFFLPFTIVCKDKRMCHASPEHQSSEELMVSKTPPS